MMAVRLFQCLRTTSWVFPKRLPTVKTLRPTGSLTATASQSGGGWHKHLPMNLFGKAAGKLAAFFLLTALCVPATAQDTAIWQVGRFSFSDELGGFKITGVSGSGTRRDPYYMRQVFTDPNEATLVNRTHEMKNVASLPNNNITHSAIHLYIEITNESQLPWI